MRTGFAALALWLALAGSAPADSLRLELYAPTWAGEEPVETPLSWVEVRGRVVRADLADPDVALALALLRSLTPSGVILALDLSQSSLLPTGSDLDQDGTIGVLRPHYRHRKGELWSEPFKWWTTDWGDTVVHAQLRIAELLVRELEEREIPVGVITFTDRPKWRAPVGGAPEARSALSGIRFSAQWTGARFDRVLRAATRRLEAAGPLEATSIVFFSDGRPDASRKRPPEASWALAAAREVAPLGVHIHGLGLGEEIAEDSGVLEEMAELTGGRYLSLPDPAALERGFERLRGPAPELELSIENRTTGAPARAQRLFSDGSFDGFVPLVPGVNELRVSVREEGGDPLSLLRRLLYAPPEVRDRAALGAERKLLRRLRERTAETELVPPSAGGEALDLERSLRLHVERVAPEPEEVGPALEENAPDPQADAPSSGGDTTP